MTSVSVFKNILFQCCWLSIQIWIPESNDQKQDLLYSNLQKCLVIFL